MGPLPLTVIVVPCFNEAGRLQPAAFAAALGRHPHLRFVFVDDGSRDGTAAIIEQLIACHPERVSLVRLEDNRGKAEAIRRGILHARSMSPDLAGYWDADLATPLDDVAALAQALANPSVVLAMASRVRMLGRDVERSAGRHYIGRVFATMASLQLRLPVYDTQCGAKLFKLTPQTGELFARPFRLRWCFDVELIARFREAAGPGACVEVPVTRWVDAGGSKLTWRQAVRIVPEIMRLPAVMRAERTRRD